MSQGDSSSPRHPGASGQTTVNSDRNSARGSVQSDGSPDDPYVTIAAGEQILSRLVRGPQLGSGAFGSVFLGQDSVTGQLYAVKEVIFDSADKRGTKVLRDATKEFNVLCRISHPNVVRLHGAVTSYLSDKPSSTLSSPPASGPTASGNGSNDSDDMPAGKGPGLVHIILEYVPGGSAAQLISTFGSVPELLCASIVADCLLGMYHLHEHGIVHRDIKPANILLAHMQKEVAVASTTGDSLTTPYLAKLSDFGSCGQVYHTAQTAATGNGVVGTPVYMPPEAIRERNWTPAGDVWSMGASLMHMLTGQPPWNSGEGGGDLVQLIFTVGMATGPPPWPKGCKATASARAFVARCMTAPLANRPGVLDLLCDPFVAPYVVARGQDVAIPAVPAEVLTKVSQVVEMARVTVPISAPADATSGSYAGRINSTGSGGGASGSGRGTASPALGSQSALSATFEVGSSAAPATASVENQSAAPPELATGCGSVSSGAPSTAAPALSPAPTPAPAPAAATSLAPVPAASPSPPAATGGAAPGFGLGATGFGRSGMGGGAPAQSPAPPMPMTISAMGPMGIPLGLGGGGAPVFRGSFSPSRMRNKKVSNSQPNTSNHSSPPANAPAPAAPADASGFGHTRPPTSRSGGSTSCAAVLDGPLTAPPFTQVPQFPMGSGLDETTAPAERLSSRPGSSAAPVSAPGADLPSRMSNTSSQNPSDQHASAPAGNDKDVASWLKATPPVAAATATAPQAPSEGSVAPPSSSGGPRHSTAPVASVGSGGSAPTGPEMDGLVAHGQTPVPLSNLPASVAQEQGAAALVGQQLTSGSPSAPVTVTHVQACVPVVEPPAPDMEKRAELAAQWRRTFSTRPNAPLAFLPKHEELDTSMSGEGDPSTRGGKSA